VFVWAFEYFGSRSRDGDDDAGGGARGRRLSLARVTATTTLAEARGRRLSLARVTATTTLAEARADVGSRFLA